MNKSETRAWITETRPCYVCGQPATVFIGEPGVPVRSYCSEHDPSPFDFPRPGRRIKELEEEFTKLQALVDTCTDVLSYAVVRSDTSLHIAGFIVWDLLTTYKSRSMGRKV